jgi:mannose-1-phosphate guanylyltransferase
LSSVISDHIVVCNEDQRFLITQQLQSIGVKKARILLEPKGRNTAPAIALAALEALRNQSPDALLLVLPADHEIRDVAAFELAVAQAIALAKQGGLVCYRLVQKQAMVISVLVMIQLYLHLSKNPTFKKLNLT